MRWCVAAVLLVSVAGCASPRHSSMHDNFVACIKPDGTPYMVEVEDGTCAKGEDATRCILPDAASISTHSVAECEKRGGRVPGVSKR
jgi:hypothetical protein